MRINKQKVLSCLIDEDYLRPMEISEKTGLHQNTVSKELRLLKKEGLVYCLNPEYYKPRLYRLTNKGKKVNKRRVK